MWGESAPSLLGHKEKEKKKKTKRFTLEPKTRTSARNYNIVKSIVHWTKRGKKKGPVGCKYWVVRKVLKWRWLALLPVRLLLLLFAGGPSQCQATQVCCCCCCRLVDPGSSKWKAAGDGCLACLCLGRYEHMNQKHGAWIEDGVESGWLERSARATTAAVGCLLSVAPASPSPSPTSFAKLAEDFLLHGFCNKLVIYLSSSVSNNSIRGLDFLVVDFLLLSFCSCCLFVCLFLGITVCSMSSVSGFVFFLVFGMCVLELWL